MSQDVHDGVPPKVTKWKGGNSTYEWPICPGCGGRMHRKRTRCTKCRHADERRLRTALITGLLVIALAWPAVVQSAGLPDVQARYVAALHQRDHGDPVGAWFTLIRVAGDTLPRTQGNPEVHHQLAVIARAIASLSFYFGQAWAADADTGAWPVCVRFQLGYLYAAEGLVQCTLSGSRRAHRFPWTKLGGVASLLRERLRGLGCAVPGPVRLWAAGDP